KILSETLLSINSGEVNQRERVEKLYNNAWKKQFENRLSTGRRIQQLFGRGNMSGITVQIGKSLPAVGYWLMKRTHGKPFGQ
ncbi:MAG: FAD-dependent oxidoreductase, partial [Cyclobacteriaceae bacterium]